MTWLSAIVKGLVSAILDWWQGQAEKPAELKDDETPKNVKSNWDKYIANELRDKNDGGDRQTK